MKIKFFFTGILLSLLIFSCSDDSMDYKVKTPYDSEHRVVFNVSNFKVENTLKSSSLEDAGIKFVEYFCFLKNGENEYELISQKQYRIENQAGIVIEDSLPKGDYRVNILAATMAEESPDFTFLFNPGTDAQFQPVKGYENCGWTYKYDNDLFSKIIDFTVMEEDEDLEIDDIVLSRIVGKVNVTLENIYASSLPEDVNYIVCSLGGPQNDIGQVFSLITNEWRYFEHRYFNVYTNWDEETTVLSKEDIEEMNSNGIFSHTFSMNLLPGSGSTLAILGRYSLIVYPSELDNNIFTIPVNNSGTEIADNKIINFRGKLYPDASAGIVIGDIDIEWDEEEIDGGTFGH